MLYDAVALIGLLAAGALAALPLNRGEAIPAGTVIFQLWLLMLMYLYFALSWRHGGQTLGMRAWKIKLVDEGGKVPGWLAVTLRFGGAILSLAAAGLGYLTAALPPHLTWHDRWTKTRVVSAVT